ncbi:nickel/cobalt transporter [Celerinatantimonas sp. YJH-8]|uniref:nickel/cobalt transporter n=1 Tax=Celerinatantimonas sp. YJH-8 TaxID=3228714 RepID=UPI0038C25FE5
MNTVLLKRAGALLGLLLCIAIGWLVWPHLLIAAMQAQQILYSHFNQLLFSINEHQWHALSSLSLLSFAYGIFHAVGPGHGKVVMSSYLVSHREQLRRSILLTLLAAIAQAVFAITVVSLLRFVYLQTAHQINQNALTLIHFNSLLIIALALWFGYKAYKIIYPQPIHYRTFKAIPPQPLLTRPSSGTTCGCGHHHFIDDTHLNSLQHWRDYLALIASIGARPCSGALFLLSVCALLGIYWVGIICTFIMALGTGITTSAIASLTVSARQWFLKLYPNHRPNRYLQAAPMIGSALLLLVIGIVLYQIPVWQGMPHFLRH